MNCKNKLYFNPFEIPEKIHFISTARKTDITFDAQHLPSDYPAWFDDLFKAIKKGDYDEIIVTVSAHEGCYYPKRIGTGLYKRMPLVGEISLSQFSNGGGYLKDNHIYVE